MDSSRQRIRISDLPTSHTHTSRMTHGTPKSGTKFHAVVQAGNEEVIVDSYFASSSRSETRLLQYHMDMIGLHEFVRAVVSSFPMKDEETIEEMKNPEGPMLEQPLAFMPLSDNMAIKRNSLHTNNLWTHQDWEEWDRSCEQHRSWRSAIW
jgi:hypothetical protein